jgi:hypothetical protein
VAQMEAHRWEEGSVGSMGKRSEEGGGRWVRGGRRRSGREGGADAVCVERRRR